MESTVVATIPYWRSCQRQLSHYETLDGLEFRFWTVAGLDLIGLVALGLSLRLDVMRTDKYLRVSDRTRFTRARSAHADAPIPIKVSK
jgi:hypothetical protein